MLLRHGVLHIEVRYKLHTSVVAVDIGGVVARDVDDDLARATVQTPDPVIIVVADRRWKAGLRAPAKKVDRTGVAIVISDDADLRAVGG